MQRPLFSHFTNIFVDEITMSGTSQALNNAFVVVLIVRAMSLRKAQSLPGVFQLFPGACPILREAGRFLLTHMGELLAVR
ncbi:MAG: hypothetical protein V3U96_08890 [Paracoccaceae bacterium]